MRDFEKHFGDNTVLQLTKTFRCPQDMCEIAGTFVMANSFQIKKAVTSTNERTSPSLICFHLDTMEGQDALLRTHIGKLADRLRSRGSKGRCSVYVLGRYHHDQPVCVPEIRGDVADVIDLQWSTIHAAKGLEADYVFLVNVIEANFGIPSQIEDDSTLWIAMPEGENYPHAEERRLFYVALTRAKRLTTIYTDANSRSEFVAELERHNPEVEVRIVGGYERERRDCPDCDIGLLNIRKSRYGEFLGCSRFPKCDFTEKLPGPPPAPRYTKRRQRKP
jgi:DNA helicase-4